MIFGGKKEKKGADAAKKAASALIIGSDTIIVCNGKVMRKTASEKVARASLRFISGKRCTAYTGVCIILKEGGKTLKKSHGR